MNSNRIILVLICSILPYLGVMAQSERKQHHQKAQEELAVYFEENISPVMGPKRNLLDQVLSQEDQEELEQIRTEIQALHAQMRESRKAHHSMKHEEMSEADRDEFKARMKHRRLLMTRAWAIVDQYEAEIDALLSSIEPQISTWREDIRDIKDSHRPSIKGKKTDQSFEESQKSHHGSRHHPHGHRRGKGSFNRLMSPVGFLLWSPDHNPFSRIAENEASPNLLSVFPNPTHTRTTIQYELAQKGDVSIQVLDPQGTAIQSFDFHNQEKGSQQQQIDISNLKSGVYIIRIETASGIQSQKLVIE